MPVVAGAGYGTALAVRYARLAEEAGADGLLAMPPYLVVAGQEGLLRHYRELAAATAPADVIVYQRDNAVFTPETVVELARTDGIIGFKDGLGDLDLMQRIVSAVRTEVPGDFLYFNGLPTAELTGLAYRGIGVTLYSSAVFCFAPEIALAFHRALADRRRRHRAPAPRRLLPARSSNCAPRAAATPSPWSRPAYGCAAWTSARCGRRCTSRAEDHVKQLAELIERGRALLERGRDGEASEGVRRSSTPGTSTATPRPPRRIAGLGVQQVTLAAAYHSTRALTPRHPRHRIVTAEHAAVLYPPDDRWQGRELRPYAAGDWAPGRRLRRGRRRRSRTPVWRCTPGSSSPTTPAWAPSIRTPPWSTPTATATPGPPASPSPPRARTSSTWPPRPPYAPARAAPNWSRSAGTASQHLHAHDKTGGVAARGRRRST